MQNQENSNFIKFIKILLNICGWNGLFGSLGIKASAYLFCFVLYLHLHCIMISKIIDPMGVFLISLESPNGGCEEGESFIPSCLLGQKILNFKKFTTSTIIENKRKSQGY